MKQTGYWYLRISNILVKMILFVENTSNHFEWAPMMTINIKLMNGPVKSICVLPTENLIVTMGTFLPWVEHLWYSDVSSCGPFALCVCQSMATMYIRVWARDFICTMPKWLVWMSAKTNFWHETGTIITCIPHNLLPQLSPVSVNICSKVVIQKISHYTVWAIPLVCTTKPCLKEGIYFCGFCQFCCVHW